MLIVQVLLFAALAITVGLALTFSGYGLFRIIFPIWGFFVGLWLGGSVIAGALGGAFLATSFGLIIGLLLGLVFAGLAYFVYSFAIILFGGSLGYALGQGLILMLGIDKGVLSWTTGVIVAILFAIGFIMFQLPRIFIIVSTAFAGSSAIIAGVMALFLQVPPNRLGLAFAEAVIQESWFWWIVWVIIAFLGMMVQSALSRAAMLDRQYDYETFMAEQSKPQSQPTKPAKVKS